MNWEQIITEVEFTAVRSRGPGGQNVNKVSSAAQLTWPFFLSSGLSEEEKQRIAQKMTNKINQVGEVYLRSDEFRDYPRNRERCLEKLHEFVTIALHRAKPRRATRPTKASRLRKREQKSQRSHTKRLRQRVTGE